ncbi:winged helix-turn-helix domain-containing protein [Flindersiella endophytica]
MNDDDRAGLTLNEVGDVVLRDARQLRALADSDRLRVFEWLQRHGPVSAARIAEQLSLPADEAEGALRTLQAAGLVEPTEAEEWRAHGRGMLLQPADDDTEALAAARELGIVMLRAAADLPGRWLATTEPTLDLTWAQAASLFNAGVVLTPGELEEVQEDLERLLVPYLNRRPEDLPAAGRRVRILSFFLPEADS